MKKLLTGMILVGSMAMVACESDSPSSNANVTSNDVIDNATLNIQTIENPFFTIDYALDLKGATKVSYTLTNEKVTTGNIKKRPHFYTEPSLPKESQTTHKDYTNTGHDRGHLANDASFDWSKESQLATYSMANIVPQLPDVNRHAWLAVEDYERYMAAQFSVIDVINVIEYKEDHILEKLPLAEIVKEKKFKNAKHEADYSDKYKKHAEKLLAKRIYLPVGFYKVIKTNQDYGNECFYMANDETVTSTKHDAYSIDCSKVPTSI